MCHRQVLRVPVVLVWCPLDPCLKEGHTLEDPWKGSVKAGSMPVEGAAAAAQQNKVILREAPSDLKVLKKSWTLTAIMLLPAVEAPSQLNSSTHTCHLASCMTLALCTLGCSMVPFLPT